MASRSLPVRRLPVDALQVVNDVPVLDQSHAATVQLSRQLVRLLPSDAGRHRPQRVAKVLVRDLAAAGHVVLLVELVQVDAAVDEVLKFGLGDGGSLGDRAGVLLLIRKLRKVVKHAHRLRGHALHAVGVLALGDVHTFVAAHDAVHGERRVPTSRCEEVGR